jgi:hypothetical protein
VDRRVTPGSSVWRTQLQGMTGVIYLMIP